VGTRFVAFACPLVVIVLVLRESYVGVRALCLSGGVPISSHNK
jgi:hypothetical protein